MVFLLTKLHTTFADPDPNKIRIRDCFYGISIDSVFVTVPYPYVITRWHWYRNTLRHTLQYFISMQEYWLTDWLICRAKDFATLTDRHWDVPANDGAPATGRAASGHVKAHITLAKIEQHPPDSAEDCSDIILLRCQRSLGQFLSWIRNCFGNIMPFFSTSL